MYLWIRLKGSKIYIRVGSVSFGKGQKAFKIRPVNLKSRSPRASLRIHDGVEHSNYQKPQHLYFTATKNLNNYGYFHICEAWKNEFGSYLFPLCLTFNQQYKKSNRGHKLSYTFSFILAHIGTPANVQNNYIKIIWFLTGFNKTNFLLQGNGKHYLPIKSSSTPKILSEFPITNLLEFFQYSPFYCRLNSIKS